MPSTKENYKQQNYFIYHKIHNFGSMYCFASSRFYKNIINSMPMKMQDCAIDVSSNISQTLSILPCLPKQTRLINKAMENTM